MVKDGLADCNKKFDMRDLGKLSYYLGTDVGKGSGYTELKQTAYAKKLLDKAGLADCNPIKYPARTKIQLGKDDKGKAVNSTQLKSLVGGLRYLVHSRTYITFLVGVVSRFMERPTVLHMNVVKRILRYKGTINYGLVHSKGNDNYLLAGYSDSDLRGNSEDRKSTGAWFSWTRI